MRVDFSAEWGDCDSDLLTFLVARLRYVYNGGLGGFPASVESKSDNITESILDMN